MCDDATKFPVVLFKDIGLNRAAQPNQFQNEHTETISE